ncbi:arginine N-succinyltransferase [Pseudomonas sp. 2FE]|uniref:arginine N-succinyltransferase n=1 Tax=Pseudomonas sp. 2FE TaxID=2502190 RepID=UPI0010F99006|nr:arginine N-succinyltransferase [Pseudomonas sp. 2FE]
MRIIRPARMADLPQVESLAKQSLLGVASLPNDLAALEQKLRHSQASFQDPQTAGDEASYFFVLEDLASGELLGCSALTARVGVLEPFYSLRNEVFVHASAKLQVKNKVGVLALCQDLSGSSLLSSFHVQDELVGGPFAELTSRARLMFIAAQPQLFSRRIVAEMVGQSDSSGNSPFWEALGRNFFDMDYAKAELLCGQGKRTFLAELLPRYPIYVPLLSESAQAVLGRVHPQAQATFELLRREGFETERYVDIFDAGPTLQAQTSTLRSIAHSRLATVRLGPVAADGKAYLLSNQKLGEFRATVTQLHWQEGGPLTLSPSMAAALLLAEGDSIRLIAMEEAA